MTIPRSSPGTVGLTHYQKLDAKLAWDIQQADMQRLAEMTWADKDRIIAALRRLPAPAQSPPERIAELQYEAGMYQSLYELAIKECQAWREAVVRLHDLAIDGGASAIEDRCFNILMERSLYPVPSTTRVHDSDCSTHNAPALPVGPCDCSMPSKNQP